MSALTVALLGLLVRPASAVSWSVGADLVHEALGAPGYQGGALFGGPFHPGGQAEGALRFAANRFVAGEQLLRVGGWYHAEVEGLVFASTAARVVFVLPADLFVSVEPVELGLGFSSLAGRHYSVGEDGLEPSSDALHVHLLTFAGLGLGWRLPDLPVSLRLGYRAGLEWSPPPVLELPFLPHSTLSLGVSVDLKRRPE